MLYRLRQSISRFMYGRYGIDRFHYFLMILFLIIAVANCFVRTFLLQLLQSGLLVYMFFRVFSKNIYKRSRENEWFLRGKSKAVDFINFQKNKASDKSHCYKKCPHCKSKLRLPRKRGRHTVECPRCKKDFKIRIFR